MKYLFFVLLLTISCAKESYEYKPRLIAFGDSITSTKDPLTYAWILADKLNIPITNEAVPGSKIYSPNQYELIMHYNLSAQDVVVYIPGANDANKATDVILYENLLTEILFKISGSGARGYIGTTMHMLPPEFPNIDTYADILRRVMANNNFPNLTLVDTNLMFKPEANNMSDHIHPGNLGHEQIARMFMSQL